MWGKQKFQCTRYCASVSEIIPLYHGPRRLSGSTALSAASSLDLEMGLKVGLQRKKQQDTRK